MIRGSTLYSWSSVATLWVWRYLFQASQVMIAMMILFLCKDVRIHLHRACIYKHIDAPTSVHIWMSIYFRRFEVLFGDCLYRHPPVPVGVLIDLRCDGTWGRRRSRFPWSLGHSDFAANWLLVAAGLATHGNPGEVTAAVTWLHGGTTNQPK